MECLQIDWKNIDGTFDKDDFYESIQAPKWIDFTVPIQPVDDHAWFCGKAGCTHEIKTVLQALNQGNANPFETCMKSSVGPSTAKTLSAGAAAIKKTRPLVSSSLSSLSELKAAYAKNKVLRHVQMPPINESKAQATKNSRRQQASENENPNRACKLQDGACTKPPIRAPLEGTARHTKASEMKRIIGKEANARASTADPSFRSAKTSVSLSQTGPLMEASKSVFIFGNRDPTYAKSTLLNKAIDKEPLSDNITEAQIKKAGGGTCFFSRPSPTARNPYLSASLATPIVRRSAANARPLHGVCLGNDKVMECKPPRVTRDVRVTVQANACQKRKDYHKKNANIGKIAPQVERSDRPEIGSKDSAAIPHSASSLEEQDTQRELKEGESILDKDSSAAPIASDKQLLHPSQGAVQERKSADIQTRDKEDSITDTLEKFLGNLQITPHDNETVSNESVESAKEQGMVNPHDKEIVREEASMQIHQDVDDDILKHVAVTSNHAAGQNTSEHDCKQDMMEKVGRCSLDRVQLSQIREPLICEDERNPLSTASHVSSDDGSSAKDEVLSLDNDNRPKKVQQKQSTMAWQKCRGTKRKSSELNLNCLSKNDKHGTQKQLKQSSSTAKLPIVSSSQRPGLQEDSGEEQHKKLKTTAVQAFKPFRFRTEERGALKELGLGKKESGSPKSKDTVHHALRMPSFGRPFRPQRSTKKLTIPKEPKFHVSRTKNTCSTSLVTDLPS